MNPSVAKIVTNPPVLIHRVMPVEGKSLTLNVATNKKIVPLAYGQSIVVLIMIV